MLYIRKTENSNISFGKIKESLGEWVKTNLATMLSLVQH